MFMQPIFHTMQMNGNGPKKKENDKKAP